MKLADYVLVGAIGLLLITPVIAYCWWAIRGIQKKLWRKVAMQLGVPVLLVVLGLCGVRVWDHFEGIRYWTGVFGDGVRVRDPIFAYYSQRAFNGDGASAEAFVLPDNVTARVDAGTFVGPSGYPKLPSWRAEWKQVDWTHGPVKEEHRRYFDFVMWAVREAAQHDARFDRIETLLKSRGCIYALFYKADKAWIGDVDLFVIDLHDRRFYLVNLNT
jgi:hypothetical protein